MVIGNLEQGKQHDVQQYQSRKTNEPPPPTTTPQEESKLSMRKSCSFKNMNFDERISSCIIKNIKLLL